MFRTNLQENQLRYGYPIELRTCSQEDLHSPLYDESSRMSNSELKQKIKIKILS